MQQLNAIQEVIRGCGGLNCVECGRCVAVCPMNEMYKNFSIEMSPRGIIKKAVMGSAILEDSHIWYCTECNAGTDVCPEGVSCRDLIKGLRRLAVEQGAAHDTRPCGACGQAFVAVPVVDYIGGRLPNEPTGFLELCPACRRQVYLQRNARY